DLQRNRGVGIFTASDSGGASVHPLNRHLASFLPKGFIMKKTLLSVALVASSLFAASAATAAPVIYNLSLPNISTFDNVIAGTGSTVTTAQVVVGQSTYNYIDKD